MDDRNAQVGWTEAQWNRVREEVLRAWQSVRVAGSFLPAYGPLPSSTEVVPSEILKQDGTVDTQATAILVEISLPVTLTRQQVTEEDLSSALLQFRRRATQVGLLEDWFVFNGIYASEELVTKLSHKGDEKGDLPRYLPDYSFLDDVIGKDSHFMPARSKQIARATAPKVLLQLNPGALGLIDGAQGAQEDDKSKGTFALNSAGLIGAVVDAMDRLEKRGYVAPYVCVFGIRAYEAAHRPQDGSITFPRDRIEPLIGRQLLHASAIDIRPRESVKDIAAEWQKRGVLLSLAGDAVDLAIAAEATPEFRQVDMGGRYVFSVFERFALRVKDPKAIVPLDFDVDPRTKRPPKEQQPQALGGLAKSAWLRWSLRRFLPGRAKTAEGN